METQVLIIGAGATGAGILRDLSMRGVSAILVDQKDASAGATGGNHGLLHSGARYAVKDLHSAEECAIENAILKKTFSHCIDPCGGYFVAVEGDDEKYIADFATSCEKAGIKAEKVDPEEAKENEPALAKNIIAAYKVPDASVDPFMLTLENIANALELPGSNAQFLRHHKVIGFIRDSRHVIAAKVLNTQTGEIKEILADQFINATGAWAANVAALAGCKMEMTLSKGTLIITQSRLTKSVINRLRAPGDGDILVPGGSVSILGTTSVTVDNPDDHFPTVEEVDANLRQGIPMVPSLATTPYIRAYAGIRPLLKSTDADGRGASRGFALVTHEESRVSNFVTVTGGKLTTYRLMAEKTVDFICQRLGVDKKCETADAIVTPSRLAEWADPSLKHKYSWWQKHTPHDYLLCECEVVPRSAVDKITKNWNDNSPAKAQMSSIAARSRVGKGPCQGTFCGARVTAHLYDTLAANGADGVEGLRTFLNSRWRGQRYVMWGKQFSQAELKEALYFGLLGLEDEVQ